jgi:hypothetical protein
MFPIVPFRDLIKCKKPKLRMSAQEELQGKLFYLQHGTPEQVKMLVKKDPMLYVQCSLAHKSNVAIFNEAIGNKSRKHIFAAAPPCIKDNKVLMADTFMLYPKLFGFAPLKYRKNKKFVLDLFDFLFGEELQYCILKLSKTLQRDHDVLTIYVRRMFSGSVLKTIGRLPAIAQHMDLACVVLENAKSYRRSIEPLIEAMPSLFLKEKETALQLIKRHGEVYRFIPLKLQQEQDVFDAACDAGFNALSVAPHFCHRNAVLRYSGCLADAPELEFDVDLLTKSFAVSADGFKYARTPIRMNPIVAGTALKAGLKVDELPLMHLEDEDFVREHFDILTSYLNVHHTYKHMPPALAHDKTMLKQIVAKTPFMITNVPVEVLGGAEWIYVLARCRMSELTFLRATAVSLSDVFMLVMPLLKEARKDALGANAFVFSKAAKKRRRGVAVKDLAVESVREVVAYLMPPDYADYRKAVANYEQAMQVDFDALP